MKKLLLPAFMLAVLSSGTMFAQSFPGTWQGALKIPQAPNGELRLVIKIETTDADGLKGEFYSIDQKSPAIPTTVTAKGTSIKMAVAQAQITYEGQLSADGKTINGTFTQGAPTPLVLTRATPETAWTIPEAPPVLKMMAPDANPSFEVATIKPSDPNRPGFGIGLNATNGMFSTRGTTFMDLIKFGYDLHPKQVQGLPSWAESDKYDLSGKPDTPGLASVKLMQVMLQKLMVDRFSFKYHMEKKELTAYVITVAKGGAKIQEEKNSPVAAPGFGGIPQRGFMSRNATIGEFASIVQGQFLDAPVVDQTGFGNTRYTFTLKFTMDPSMRPFGGALPDAPAPSPDAEAPPDIYAAMEQQLGLHIQKTKAQVDVMVIDKVEKPSDN